jgi:hypothetical protein
LNSGEKPAGAFQIARIMSCSEACAGCHVFFPADDRQEYLDLLSQSASKHALDLLVSDESSRHFVVVRGQERSLACTFQKSIAIFREGWRVIVARALPFFDGRTERSGVTHEKQGLCFLRVLSSVRSD